MFNLFKKKKRPEKQSAVTDQSRKLSVHIVYSYEWKEEIPLSERDTPEHPSRPFCKKLMELEKLYSRSDIEKMSMRLGYSVWERCGGDDCRHRWVQQTIVKELDK